MTLNWKVRKKRYNRFKRFLLRHREFEYRMLMTNKLMSNGIIPKRRNVCRAVEYVWQHGNIYESTIRLLSENHKLDGDHSHPISGGEDIEYDQSRVMTFNATPRFEINDDGSMKITSFGLVKEETENE